MAAVDTDEYVSPDLQRKRSRHSAAPEDELAPKPPTKIKLSLKLGALRKQAAAVSDHYTSVDCGSPGLVSVHGSNTDDEHVDIDDHSKYAGIDNHVDIDGHVDTDDHVDTFSHVDTNNHVDTHNHSKYADSSLASPLPAVSAGLHTPRIKLRFSLKSAAYADSPLGSTGPGSPANSVAPVVYSPGQVSDADSDEQRDGSFIDSDDAYDQLPPTPQSAGPRRRGRPPLRGARSYSVVRRQTLPPAPARTASESLTTTVSLKSSLQRLIKRIRKRDSYGFFLEPVDTAVVSDYLGVIDNPMDLGTMQRKANASTYRSIGEFRSDLMLVCANARKYNGAGSIYAKSADHVQEYALVAIDRETVKLERVGKATLPDASSGYGAHHMRSRTESMSPSRYSVADDYSDSHPGSGYGVDAGAEFRRSTRLRWRGASDAQQTTPASIVDIFKWSAASKKKSRKSNVPKRHTDAQKIPLAADGSIDSAVFEEDVARIPFEQPLTALPLLAGVRPPRSAASSANWPTYAHGRYYLPATQLDFGPFRTLPTTAIATAGIDSTRHMLNAVHGDALGLAYWRSVSEFIDGAGDEVSQYAATVMDHLSSGTHAVARDMLRHLKSRNLDGSSTAPTAVIVDKNGLDDKSGLSDKGGLSDVELSELVAWLDSRPERERVAAQRSEALSAPLLLRDVSARCASGENKAPRPDVLTLSQRHELLASNNRALKNLYEQQQSDSNPTVTDLDVLDAGIYALAEHACLAATGSKQPTTYVPRAPLPVRTPVSRPQLAPAITSVPQPRGGATRVLAPRPNRAVSTPTLSTLHSASLASAVRSELMDGLAPDSGSDRGYPL
ncbi:hypothetical protein GGH96_004046 [Coemansia sp. RSA 1972]|nr:hypothetical protein GGH96_004046 [Coemansia sp. RSA 1972]